MLVENGLKNLKIFAPSDFRGKKYFEEDGAQHYLVFQPMYRYFKIIIDLGNGNSIYYWKYKRLSDERISSIKTSDYGITPKLNYYGTKTRVEFNGRCLKQDKITYTHVNIVNIYIVYELTGSNSDDNENTVKNTLFGAVNLTKNADIYKCGYSDYEIGFYRRRSFSFPVIGSRQNVIIFGVDMSTSVHVDNKKGHFNSRKRTNTRVRTYINRRKNVFN